MKKILALLLCGLILCGCTPFGGPAETQPATEPATEATTEAATETTTEAATEATTEAATEVTTEPATEADPEPVSITIYYANANADGFETTEFEAEEVTAEFLMAKLIEMGALNEAVVLNSMENAGGHLTLDFNTAFEDQIYTMGTAGERMMMGSVVNTFLKAFDAEDAAIRVEGQILESGHVVYDEPMGLYK